MYRCYIWHSLTLEHRNVKIDVEANTAKAVADMYVCGIGVLCYGCNYYFHFLILTGAVRSDSRVHITIHHYT